MMFSNLDEVRQFITWCKDQRLKSVSFQELKVEFGQPLVMQVATEPKEKQMSELFPAMSKEEEEILFHSAQGV